MYDETIRQTTGATRVSFLAPHQAFSSRRLDRIIVHDFTANPADVPPESPFAARLAGAVPPTPEQRELGRKLGAQIATDLVRAAGQQAPQTDDVVLRGYVVSIEEGSAGKRVLVGFGSGAAEMRAAVEGYQVTTAGLRLLGSGEVSSEGGECQGSRHRWPSSPPPPPGETLHGLAKRHDISRNLIRVWVAK